MSYSTLLSGTHRLLDALQAHDPATREHSERTGVLAAALAAELRLSLRDQAILRLGGALHDVGKRSVPREILTGDMRFVRTDPLFIEHIIPHPTAGAYLCSLERIDDEVIQVIVEHHERLDGLGYPFRMKAGQINWRSMFVSIADMFDAMTDTTRIYRRPKTGDEAITVLRDAVGNGEIPEHPVRALLAIHERGEIAILHERAEPLEEIIRYLST